MADTKELNDALVQLTMVAQEVDEAQAQNKVVQCGFQAFLVFLRTRDRTAAIQSFISCLFGAEPPGNGGGNGGGNNPSGINREVSRC